MVFSVQQIKYEILAYMKEFGGEFGDYYVGIAADPKKTLLEVHKVDEAADPWLYKQALTFYAARTVQDYFLRRLKADGEPVLGRRRRYGLRLCLQEERADRPVADGAGRRPVPPVRGRCARDVRTTPSRRGGAPTWPVTSTGRGRYGCRWPRQAMPRLRLGSARSTPMATAFRPMRRQRSPGTSSRPKAGTRWPRATSARCTPWAMASPRTWRRRCAGCAARLAAAMPMPASTSVCSTARATACRRTTLGPPSGIAGRRKQGTTPPRPASATCMWWARA